MRRVSIIIVITTIALLVSATAIGAAAATPLVKTSYAFVLNAGDDTLTRCTIAPDGALKPLPGVVATGGRGSDAVVADPTGHYIYVANKGSSDITVLKVGDDGSLSSLPDNAVTLDTAPLALTVAPGGKRLYVACTSPGPILGFAIGADGSLTPESKSPFNRSTIQQLIFDPSGKFVYVIVGSDNVSMRDLVQLAVASDGSLGALPNRRFNNWDFNSFTTANLVVDSNTGTAFGSDGDNVAEYKLGSDGRLVRLPAHYSKSGYGGYNRWSSAVMSPSGKFYYLAANADQMRPGSISEFRVRPNGELTALHPFQVAGCSQPGPMAVSPNGQTLYLADGAANRVWMYHIGDDGQLTPFAAHTVDNPGRIFLAPNGKSAYVLSTKTYALSQYTVGPTGKLAAMNPATVSGPGFGLGMFFSPTGSFAYVPSSTFDNLECIQAYRVGTAGGLSPTESEPLPYMIANGYSSADPFGKWLYQAAYDKTFIVSLSSPAAPRLESAVDSPRAVSGFIAYHPKLPIVYAGAPSAVLAYDVRADGSLTPRTVSSYKCSGQIQAGIISPTGSRMYAYSAGGGGTIVQFSVDAAGALTPLPDVPAQMGAAPIQMAVNPSRRTLYLLTSSPAAVYAFHVDASTLTPLSSSPFVVTGEAHGLVFDATGSTAYITDATTSSVDQYSVNADGSFGESAGAAFIATRNKPISIVMVSR